MRLVTHADRSELSHPDVDLAEFLQAQARTRALPLWVGRVLFGGYFIYNGLNHFMNLQSVAGYAATNWRSTMALPVPHTGW